MGTISQSALILRPRQPFLAWRNAIETREGRKLISLEELRIEPKLYLVRGFKGKKHVEETVFEEFDLYFIDQLVGCMTVEREWPKHRTIETFKQWFDIEVIPWVDDTLDEDIEEEL